MAEDEAVQETNDDATACKRYKNIQDYYYYYYRFCLLPVSLRGCVLWINWVRKKILTYTAQIWSSTSSCQVNQSIGQQKSQMISHPPPLFCFLLKSILLKRCAYVSQMSPDGRWKKNISTQIDSLLTWLAWDERGEPQICAVFFFNSLYLMPWQILEVKKGGMHLLWTGGLCYLRVQGRCLWTNGALMISLLYCFHTLLQSAVSYLRLLVFNNLEPGKQEMTDKS